MMRQGKCIDHQGQCMRSNGSQGFSRPRSRQHTRATARGEAGFTLLELLVVLGIIALLATVAAPQVVGYLGKARTETAKAQISSISTALELYALDTGSFPTSLSALVSQPANITTWRGPYLKRSSGLVDPWGRPYVYRFPGRGGQPEVYTLGRDNTPGGTGEDQDLTN